jgi:phenylacetate-CoA ligase
VVSGERMALTQFVRFSLLTHQLSQATRWSAAKLARIQRIRLRRLLRHAVAKSPYFAHKFRGIDPTHCKLTDLPPSGKDELMEHFDAALTDPRVRGVEVERFIANPENLGHWFQGRYAVSHTSGSQGRPLLIVQDRRCLEIMFALMSSRAKPGAPISLSEGVRRLWSPARLAIVTTQRGFYPSGAAFEFMPELVGPYVRALRLSSQQPDLIERLNEFQPDILVGYASVLEALACQPDRLRLTRLKEVANNSEELSERALRRIRQNLCANVLDHYGAGECLLLSDGCRTDGGAHVNADWVILEVVDDDNRPVPNGQTGSKVLITNLANRVQPFIRYEIGDRLAMATAPCACGNRFPRIARVEGRSAELFWVSDQGRFRFLSGVLFHGAADSLHAVREWQAIQVERNRIDVRLQLLPGSPLAAEAAHSAFLANALACGLPSSVQLNVRLVETMEADPATGKFRRMISRTGPPPQLNGDAQ